MRRRKKKEFREGGLDPSKQVPNTSREIIKASSCNLKPCPLKASRHNS